MGWWLLRLSAKILALLRLSAIFFQLRLIVNLKIIFVKKAKADTRTPRDMPGRDIHYKRNGRFHTREVLFV